MVGDDKTQEGFDPDFYRSAYTDLRTLDESKLVEHWRHSGRPEGRFGDRAALAGAFAKEGLSLAAFDGEFYLGRYPDLRSGSIDSGDRAAIHYLTSGRFEGRQANAGEEMPVVELGQSFITRTEWTERAAQMRTSSGLPGQRQTFTAVACAGSADPAENVHPGSAPKAVVLASLYRSIDHLDVYLGNLVEQTAFAECDVCIVSVDPVPAESELIAAFDAAFANVHVHLSETRIGIYEAWNIAASMSDAPYLTNANADDLRRRDSLEVQIAGLDRNPLADVVFQDIYLTFDPSMTWEQIVAMGLRTDFPEASLATLLQGLNVPHCGPMWRRSLHDELGGFDEVFESAGDWDFWIRCADAGKTFLKLDETTVAYYANENGVSRRQDGPGFSEPAIVLDRYRHLL